MHWSKGMNAKSRQRIPVVKPETLAKTRYVEPLLTHRNTHTIGWCAAFVQFGRLHIVQRAEIR